jgi:hypothetical protein
MLVTERIKRQLERFLSVIEFNIDDHFWKLVLAIETAQLFLAALASLKIMASAVLFDRQPLVRTVR